MRPWRVFRGWTGTAVLVVAALLSLLLVMFVAQNFIVVEIRMLRWEVDIRLSWAILIAGIVGFTAGVAVARVISR